jgi:hypothetical protein
MTQATAFFALLGFAGSAFLLGLVLGKQWGTADADHIEAHRWQRELKRELLTEIGFDSGKILPLHPRRFPHSINGEVAS